MIKAISQREARRLQKRVYELEEILEKQRNKWVSDWPGGAHLGRVTWSIDTHLPSAVYTARLLKHAVVVTDIDERGFNLYALPLPVKP